MKKLIYTLILFLGISLSALSHDLTKQAKNHFANYFDSKALSDLSLKSNAPLKERKLIFKGTNTFNYFEDIEELKSNIDAETNQRFVFRTPQTLNL